jgi:hypothetical protein
MNFTEQDIEINRHEQLEAKKMRIQQEIRELSARLSYPSSIRTAVGMGAIAHHYTKSIIPGIVGAVVGYKIGQKNVLSDLDKRIILDKINKRRELLAKMEKVNPDNDKEVQGIMSAADLLNYQYPHYNFAGKWEQFMGKPSINFHAMVFGIPKSGKSILCTQFARYLSENHGTVLYIAAEEGFSMTLQNKVKSFGAQSDNLYYANYREYEPIKQAVQGHGFNFVFIDSVNYIKITPEQIEELKELSPETAFITVQQATKDGKFRGSQEFAHNCDIIIRVENGIALQQGRFQEPTQMMIFEKTESEQRKEEKTHQLDQVFGEGDLDL